VENVESASSQLRCVFVGYVFGSFKNANWQGPHGKNSVDEIFCQKRPRSLDPGRKKLFAKKAKSNGVSELEFPEGG
jgi:hypothetical protein